MECIFFLQTENALPSCNAPDCENILPKKGRAGTWEAGQSELSPLGWADAAV